jgi:hypothetical protein
MNNNIQEQNKIRKVRLPSSYFSDSETEITKDSNAEFVEIEISHPVEEQRQQMKDYNELDVESIQQTQVTTVSQNETIMASQYGKETNLDARVSLCDSRIKGKRLMVTRVYQKDLALYQYLPFISWHLPHMVRSWVASETQRYARLCFYRHDFTEITKLFKSRLMARGYPPHVVDEEIAKVDYDSVQHETLHMEVKLPDCALCNAQAATHPNPIAPTLTWIIM